MRKTVSKAFREEVKARYPNLMLCPAYWSLMRELIFRQNTYGSSGLILLQHDKLAGWNQKDPSNFNSGKFLEAFKRNVLPEFTYSDYAALEKCRSVVATGIDAEVHQWLKDMGDVREVYFETGHKVNSKSLASEYETSLAFVHSLQKLIYSEEAKHVLDYHNSKSRNKFKLKVNQNYEDALTLVESYKADSEAIYVMQRESLIDLRFFPMPLLKPTYKADRLFSYGASLTTIKSEVRKVLTRGWTEADLKNAQLAIIAKLWDIPSLQDYLATGESIWTYFYDSLEIDKSYKPALKVFVYSIAYGAGQDTLRTDFVDNCASAGIRVEDVFVKALFELPLVKDILTARKVRLNEVKGKTLFTPLGKIRSRKPTSKLALEAQAYEMLLIHEIYKLADQAINPKTNKAQFEIMLYQFDGVTIDFRDKRSKDYWKSCITKAVEAKAYEYGFKTTLEFEDL